MLDAIWNFIIGVKKDTPKPKSIPICKECKYYRNIFNNNATWEPYCVRPELMTKDIINGRWTSYECHRLRRNQTDTLPYRYCRPQGIYFEPKESPDASVQGNPGQIFLDSKYY